MIMRRVFKCAFAQDRVCHAEVTLHGWQDGKISLLSYSTGSPSTNLLLQAAGKRWTLHFRDTDCTVDRECCLFAILIARLTENIAFLGCWFHSWQRVLPFCNTDSKVDREHWPLPFWDADFTVDRALLFCNTYSKVDSIAFWVMLIAQLTECVAFLQYWLQRVLPFCSTDCAVDRECYLSAILITESVPFCNTDYRECCLSAILIVRLTESVVAQLTDSVAFLQYWLCSWQSVAFLQCWLHSWQRVLPFSNTDCTVDRECCLSVILIAQLTESVAFL